MIRPSHKSGSVLKSVTSWNIQKLLTESIVFAAKYDTKEQLLANLWLMQSWGFGVAMVMKRVLSSWLSYLSSSKSLDFPQVPLLPPEWVEFCQMLLWLCKAPAERSWSSLPYCLWEQVHFTINPRKRKRIYFDSYWILQLELRNCSETPFWFRG